MKAVIGDVGEELSFDLTVPAGETEIRSLCVVPGTAADSFTSRYWVHVSVNGRMRLTSLCGADAAGEATSQHWTYSVRAGQPGIGVEGMDAGKWARVQARVGLDDPEVTHAPQRTARIGIGVYRLGAMRVVDRAETGTRIPEVVDHQGHTYRLVDARIRWATAGAAVTVPTPAGTTFLVRYVGRGFGHEATAGVRTVRLTGVDRPVSASRPHDPKKQRPMFLPRIDPVRVEARPAATVTATLEGPGAPRSQLMLAVYRQER